MGEQKPNTHYWVNSIEGPMEWPERGSAVKVNSVSYNEYPSLEKMSLSIEISHAGAACPDATEIALAVRRVVQLMREGLPPTLPNAPKERE